MGTVSPGKIPDRVPEAFAGAPPIKQPPRLGTGAEPRARRIDSDEDARPGYHAGRVAAREQERLDSLIEIENRARRRDLARRTFGFPAGRVRDLTRFFALTYGPVLPDDDGGREDFFILAHHVARLNGKPTRNIIRYADRWCPWMSHDELAAIVRRVLARPYKWGAEKLGQRLGLLDEVRTRLGIKTIAPIDASKAQRERRWREQWNAERRKQTRADYEATSLSKAEPWKAEGMSRATWYRRKKLETSPAPKGRETGPRVQKTFSSVTRTCLTLTPRQAARQRASKGELGFLAEQDGERQPRFNSVRRSQLMGSGEGAAP